ncbi:acetyl/propionyl/methylcrotonyl-CoA carboxylase subunit alpha [Alcanivorax sp. JB21]|uniref:acetyl-CoA carboxylase biotin carboxylase subunit n=1 Tax=Alcanivorax limicola TaxID=2874102 RepID=UPI001CBAE9A8|nr:acetyl/propionyl/methylcrotonyl-CoA carboxylase subunit alpha [Alcanivorax limicola]MBZ2188087.1 acetyl/propionyl/methylcrotonyl-CoA carboxylase subunit alpha [Alcanivorax limicola]
MSASAPTSFDKILIANRGEIACRVIRTARDLGYRTVAVFSDADRDALHVQLADEAVCIGEATASQSYLNMTAILDAARRTGANAVHPGYGFMSENAEFARACQAAGIVFIGPPVDAIHLMGSKRLSKIAMQDAGVPCIPGYEGEEQSDEQLLKEAKRIGLPLMIKASAGGGGRGMRVVTDASDIPEQLRSARSEAKNAFGSDELILERAVMRPRHVEIQVFGDTHGNVIHLGERDCSVQRRHQKVVEEAPSPAVDDALRARMGEAAVQAAKACDYVGAGTVEFLLDDKGDFFFLEMNTRLQVEHPVTELITGLDLVAWQIRVARGETLPLTQDQVQLNGHAMEVRLYAEDPAAGFMPQTGPVLAWQPASGEGVRIDHGLRAGYRVGSHYDPMLAKIIAWGDTREDARRRLIRAVEDTHLFGVTDNRRFLAAILRHPVFAEGAATTAFIGADFADDAGMHALAPQSHHWAIAAVLLSSQSPVTTRHWRNSGPHTQRLVLLQGDTRQTVSLAVSATAGPGVLDVTVGDQQHTVRLGASNQCIDNQSIEVDGVIRQPAWHRDGTQLWLDDAGQVFSISDVTHAPPATTAGAGTGQIRAPMDGAVLDVRCAEGDQVSKGQVMVLLEAMKIEHSLTSDVDGIVASVTVRNGDQVKGKQILLSITPDAPEA